jgi:hypothetical protein
MIFINSNVDYNVLIGRMLVLMQQLSIVKDGKSELTVERIVIYDFFLRYPLLLAKVMRILGKKVNIDIKDNEVNTVQTFYPTYSDLYKFKSAKSLLQILYSEKFVNIEKSEDGEIVISITDFGKLSAAKLESAYFSRLREISIAISSLHSTSFGVLRNSVNSLLYE